MRVVAFGDLDEARPPAELDVDVSWWVQDHHRPTVTEGLARLAFLRVHGPSPYAFTSTELQRELAITSVGLDDVDVQLLIAQLNADLYGRYPEPGALMFSLEAADIVEGTGGLLMAVLDGRPVGCGAFRVMDDQPGSAEIKRMYVAPSARGLRIGAAVLTELEQRARVVGAERFALETGPRQPEAQALYERAGYTVCAPWGPFIGKEYSICMSKAAD